MPRRFVALNLVLAAVAALLVVYIVRQFVAPMPLPVGGRRAAAPTASSTASDAPKPSASAYNVVAARNLFSPTRTEAPATVVTATAPLVKPNLFGVVVRESGSIAYLEDPTTKRVAGFRVGDRILGGTVQTIKADGVTIDAPGGPMDVRLHEPGRPRSASPPTAAVTPPQTVAPALPGVIPPMPAIGSTPPPQVAQPPVQPGQPPVFMPPSGQPGQPPTVTVPGAQPPVVNPPVIPGRRPLPPNLLRRLPPGMGDAPQQ